MGEQHAETHLATEGTGVGMVPLALVKERYMQDSKVQNWSKCRWGAEKEQGQ